MAIRIKRNEAGNCITFEGSSNPVYWNACLSGEVDATDNTLVNVINDIMTAAGGETIYEFFRIPYTEFEDADGNAFANAAEVAAYIDLNGNVAAPETISAQYQGVYDASTNTPDITTDTSGFSNGDWFFVTAGGSNTVTANVNDQVRYNADLDQWQVIPYAGALIEFDSSSVLLNSNAAVFADGAPGLSDPNNLEHGWYFTNDTAGKRINWYFLANQNTAYEVTKSTLENGWARIKFIKNEYVYFSLYTTPKGDGFDSSWYRSRYTYAVDTNSAVKFDDLVPNEEVIVYWGVEPTVHPTLKRVRLELDDLFTVESSHPDVSNDAIYNMALSTDSSSGVDQVEFIAKELGYKNGQYSVSFNLQARLESQDNPQGDVYAFTKDVLDQTIFTNTGEFYNVNSIKAIVDDSGQYISIVSSSSDDKVYHSEIVFDNVTIDGNDLPNDINTVVNSLNQYFNQLPSGVQGDVITPIVDATGVELDGVLENDGDDNSGAYNIQDNGDGTFSRTAAGKGRYWTTERINQPGEYYTFSIIGEGTIGMGLYSLNDGDLTELEQNATLSNDHEGLLFATFLHPTPNGPWTNYGSNTSFVYLSGWNGADAFNQNSGWHEGDNTNMRVRWGETPNSYLYIDYWMPNENRWASISRTSYKLPAGEYGLVIKMNDTSVAISSTPRIHRIEDTATTELVVGSENIDLLGQATGDLAGGVTLTTAAGNNDGFVTEDTISEVNQYFELSNLNGNKNYAIGLTITEDYTNAELVTLFSGDQTDLNSGFFHGINIDTTGASDTTYRSGLGLGYDITEGPSFNTAGITSYRLGIESDGRLYISGSTDGTNFTKIVYSNSPVPQGSYSLLVKMLSDGSGVSGLEQYEITNVDPLSLSWYAIESPDGQWYFPLFLSESDAIIVDESAAYGNQPTGSAHTHVFVDDPSNRTYYMPSSIQYHASSLSPTQVSSDPNNILNSVTFNIINTESDSLHAPAQFTIQDLTVNEGQSINYQLRPQDSSFKVGYTVASNEHGGSMVGISDVQPSYSVFNLTGVAPQVSGDYSVSSNPTDTYTVTVTRENDFGSTSSTFDIIVNNLTAPSVSTTGWTSVGSIGAIDSDTIDDGSVVVLAEDLTKNHRMIFSKSWVQDYVLSALSPGQDGDKIYLGVRSGAVSLLEDGITDSDWDAYIAWEKTANGHKSIIHADTTSIVEVNSMTDAFYDYAFEADDHGDLYVIACNFNSINTEPGLDYGGQFSRNVKTTGTAPYELTMVTEGVQMDLSTVGVTEIVIPRADNWIQVVETGGHVLNFDDSATFPTLQAGYTYRLLVADVEWDDQATPTHLHGDENIRFTADGTTEYVMNNITRSGTPGDADAYFEFTVPSDVPPIWWYTDHTGINQNNGVTTSGSSYVVTITGITLEGPAANQTGTNIMDAGDHGWISLDEQLSAGERFVLDNAFFTDFLAEVKDTNNIFAIGLKGDNWTNTKEVNNSTSASTGEFFKGNTYLVGVWDSGGNAITMTIIANGVQSNSMYVNTTSLQNTVCAFIDITSSGNNIRIGFGRNGDAGINQGDESTVTYGDWTSYKGQTGDQGYGISNIDVVMSFWTFGGGAIDGNEIDWTGLSEINIPTPAVTNQTPWTKALDFSGNAERAQQVTNDSNRIPMKMGGTNNQVSAPTSGQTVTSGHPWATVVVFKSDTYNSNQHIWNLGEGAGTTDDNIYLRKDANRNLYFGWGRDGDRAECFVGTISNDIAGWHAVYVGFNGTRLGSGATAAQMAACFDIRYTRGGNGWAVGSNVSSVFNWDGSCRMNRQYLGEMTIGGRGANRSFRGKVASFVSTTLRVGVAMPTTAEIEMMITDPMKWLNDYKVGVDFRLPWQTSDAGFNFALNDGSSSYATQVWLMGDGTSDSYSNMIRNQVQPADQNYTKLNLISMVSNDIENVTINGLS